MSANNVWRRWPGYLKSGALVKNRYQGSSPLVADDVFRVPVSVKVTWAEFEVPPAAAGPRIKYWTGAAWVQKTLKRWNGSANITAPLKRWNGSAWVAA